MEPILFESHLEHRVLEISFKENFFMDSFEKLYFFKKECMSFFKTLEISFVCVIDCSLLNISYEMACHWKNTLIDFQKFFVKKIYLWSHEEKRSEVKNFGYSLYSLEEVRKISGLNRNYFKKEASVLEKMVISHVFCQGIMEISFIVGTTFRTEEDVFSFFGEIDKNILQWKNSFSILLELSVLHFENNMEDIFLSCLKKERDFLSFFIGYQSFFEDSYPFLVFSTRDEALLYLETKGLLYCPKARTCSWLAQDREE